MFGYYAGAIVILAASFCLGLAVAWLTWLDREPGESPKEKPPGSPVVDRPHPYRTAGEAPAVSVVQERLYPYKTHNETHTPLACPSCGAAVDAKACSCGEVESVSNAPHLHQTCGQCNFRFATRTRIDGYRPKTKPNKEHAPS